MLRVAKFGGYEADPVKNFLTLGFEEPLHRMLGPPLRRARRVEYVEGDGATWPIFRIPCQTAARWQRQTPC